MLGTIVAALGRFLQFGADGEKPQSPNFARDNSDNQRSGMAENAGQKERPPPTRAFTAKVTSLRGMAVSNDLTPIRSERDLKHHTRAPPNRHSIRPRQSIALSRCNATPSRCHSIFTTQSRAATHRTTPRPICGFLAGWAWCGLSGLRGRRVVNIEIAALSDRREVQHA